MLTIFQLCQHLRFILHTPVRLFDHTGSLMDSGEAKENQEDPLVCNPAYAKTLLSLRREEAPSLYYEAGSVLYAVIPAENRQTVITGPICYNQSFAGTARTVAKLHRLKHPNAYRINYVPMDIALECILMLFKELGISREYLSRIFLKEEGVRLTTYILQEKIRASEYLLMTPDASLEQIAATFAFTSQSHYGQVFRRFHDMTPNEFRERHGNRK